MNNKETFYNKLAVLYIDSNKNTSKYFSMVLEKLFKRVILKDNVKDALRFFLEDRNIDVIICDMHLSMDVQGVDALEIFRKFDDEIPFILTTGVIGVEDLIKAINHNATDFLIKPFSAESLITSLEKICYKKYCEKLEKQIQDDLSQLVLVVDEVAMISKTDIEGYITFVNKTFCEVSCYSEDELIGRKHEIIKSYQADYLKNSGEVLEIKEKNSTKNGDDFFAYLTVIPSFDENRNIKEFTWIRFLITNYELDNINFKNKLELNINENSDFNLKANEEIEILENRLIYLKTLNNQLENEKIRSDKFFSQYNYFKDEISKSELKLKEIKTKAKEKITLMSSIQKDFEDKKYNISSTIDELLQDLDLKNQNIKTLVNELNRQKSIIQLLIEEINKKESELVLSKMK